MAGRLVRQRDRVREAVPDPQGRFDHERQAERDHDRADPELPAEGDFILDNASTFAALERGVEAAWAALDSEARTHAAIS